MRLCDDAWERVQGTLTECRVGDLWGIGDDIYEMRLTATGQSTDARGEWLFLARITPDGETSLYQRTTPASATEPPATPAAASTPAPTTDLVACESDAAYARAVIPYMQRYEAALRESASGGTEKLLDVGIWGEALAAIQKAAAVVPAQETLQSIALRALLQERATVTLLTYRAAEAYRRGDIGLMNNLLVEVNAKTEVLNRLFQSVTAMSEKRAEDCGGSPAPRAGA